MRKVLLSACLALTLSSLSVPASAQLKYGTDFKTSDAIWTVTLVKVKSNMIPDYLEGIKQTWIASSEVAKQLGQIEDYAVFASELPNGGDYNLVLSIKFKDMAQYEKGRKEFAQFEEAWRKKLSEEKERTIVKGYPEMRTIVGEYMLRQVEFLK